MQAICHLSRRWHQQFCRSPSFFSHRQCLQRWQIRGFARRADPDIHVWEQEPGKPETLRPEGGVFDDDMVVARERIKQLERELAVMRKGPFAREGEFMQSLPEHKREELLKAMEEQGFEEDDIRDLSFDELLAEDEEPTRKQTLAVSLRIPEKSRAYVRKFNTALQTSDAKSKQKLWLWYLRCRQRVPGFTSHIQEDVWDHLWQTQLETHPRSPRIVSLGGDMLGAGRDLGDHLPEYLEALHLTGETRAALEMWEKTPKSSARLERIGVKLYAATAESDHQGSLAKAAKMALADPVKDTILPVIQAYAKRTSAKAAVDLWQFYSQITPTIELLGHISSILLEAGRKEMALAVFQDMMGKGQRPKVGDISEFSLMGLLALPKRFRNKFFFGAWIRWLLAEGKVQDATMVVELMQEMGIKPDAKHINGVIAAWLRQRSSNSDKQAVDIAWGMVRSRMEYVQTTRGRNIADSEQELLQKQELQTAKLPWSLRRHIPPATAETFSILLAHYAQKKNMQMATLVDNIMSGPAQIKPNTFILNTWIAVSDVASMWRRYSERNADIKPDLGTFAGLWDGCRRIYNNPSYKPKFPTPRRLFREMATWLDSLSGPERSEVSQEMTPEIYGQMIRCLCLDGDLPGVLIAIRYLQENLDLLPHNEVVGMVVMQLARMMPDDGGPPVKISGTRARQAARQADLKWRAALNNYVVLMDEILIGYVTRSELAGIDIDIEGDVEGRETQALRFEAIQTFICLVMTKQKQHADVVANEIVLAGQAMGLEVTLEDARKWVDEAVEMAEGD
jgi:pentatricopeptide repeat protein